MGTVTYDFLSHGNMVTLVCRLVTTMGTVIDMILIMVTL